MTDRQVKKVEADIRAKGYGWINGKYHEPPEEIKIREKELSCISMINSILAYQSAGMTDAEEVMQMEERNYYNYLADYVETLGRDKVVTLIQGQIDDIAYVKHCVYTDNEGVTYNAIIWKEDTEAMRNA